MRKRKTFSTPDMCLLQFDISIKFLRFKICCKIYPTIHKTPKVAQYQSKTHLTILRLEHGTTLDLQTVNMSTFTCQLAFIL